MDRVWADWYEPVPSPPFSSVDPPGPRPATPVPGSSPPSPASTPTPPKRGRYVVEHPEYGPPPDPEEVRVHGARGPGAFCAAPWHPDTRRLGADVNRLFRGIAVSAADVTGDTRALRRALFDFYAMGYTRQRPSAPCWQALLQLSPEQSAPLRSALRELNERDVYDPRVLSPVPGHAAAALVGQAAYPPPARFPASLLHALLGLRRLAGYAVACVTGALAIVIILNMR
ncbi:hypothetical protein EG867_15715 [Enterococcus faecalis]|nr:hypothetical protein EG867_15715 [Enterococcus faecalis]